jgi:hypothetical protein
VLAIPINLEKISQDLKNEFKLDEMTNIIVTNEKGIVIANLLYPSDIGKPIQRKELSEQVLLNFENLSFRTMLMVLNESSFTTLKKYNWKKNCCNTL